MRKCDYYLCISTVIAWEQCTEESNNIGILKQLKQVESFHPSPALKQTASLTWCASVNVELHLLSRFKVHVVKHLLFIQHSLHVHLNGQIIVVTYYLK